MTVRTYQGQVPVHASDLDLATHRGVAYGDGLFETMRVHHGAVHWWARHWERLSAGAARLAIRLPPRDLVESQRDQLLAGVEGATLKLLLHRGGAGRGYAPVPDAPALWQLGVSALPAPARHAGIGLRWCSTGLAVQPALAGIKHCNRLEQVLARLEWSQPDASDRQADDGLLCDTNGMVICATSANLFVLRAGTWLTPILDGAGVAGICRAWAIPALQARQTRLTRAEVESADAIFLCNALRGILPVVRLGPRVWSPHPALADARALLAVAHPAFPFSMESV